MGLTHQGGKMKNLSKRIATIAASMALVVVLGIALAACGSGKSYAELSFEQYKANLTGEWGEEAVQAIKAGDNGWENTVKIYVEDEDMRADAQWLIYASKRNESSEEDDEYTTSNMSSTMVYIVAFGKESNAKSMYNEAKEMIEKQSYSYAKKHPEEFADVEGLEKGSDEYKAAIDEFLAQLEEHKNDMPEYKLVRAGKVVIMSMDGGIDAAYTHHDIEAA